LKYIVKRIENTYAWIIATASSKIVRINLPGMAIMNLVLVLIIKPPKRLINRCPAIMLAVKRMDNVTGRIILLTNSIKTMKFIRGTGVPLGMVWITMDFGKLVHPKVMIDAHKIMAVEKEIEMWAVGVKINGHMANKFIRRITMKIDFNDGILPFMFFLLISSLISFSTVIWIVFSIEISFSWLFIFLFI